MQHAYIQLIFNFSIFEVRKWRSKKFDLWWEVKPGHIHKKRCQVRKIWVKIGWVGHRGRPCKMKTVASIPPPGIKSAIVDAPFERNTRFQFWFVFCTAATTLRWPIVHVRHGLAVFTNGRSLCRHHGLQRFRFEVKKFFLFASPAVMNFSLLFSFASDPPSCQTLMVIFFFILALMLLNTQ